MLGVVERFANEDAHLVDRTPRRHLLQLLHLIHPGVDEALPVGIGIHHTLVEHRIGQVVDQQLDAEIRRARILRLRLPCGILALPLRLTHPVRLIRLLDVRQDIVDRFLDAPLADTHRGDQHMHEGGLMIHVVPIAKPHPMQMRAKGGKHRLAHRRLIEVGHLARQQRQAGRQPCRHRGRALPCATRHRQLRVLTQGVQHLTQPEGHPLAWLLQSTLDGASPLLLLEAVVARDHRLQTPLIVVANRA